MSIGPELALFVLPPLASFAAAIYLAVALSRRRR
jgi:hypothetical protein